ncbi:MAG: flippase-like domain-containing protein [Chitinophagaceae bacterium]|nr:flippase-like domain-containing protein [Chitinophagaceae bacterium]
MKLNRNTKIFINYFLGPLLFIWLSWAIYRQIKKQPDLETAWKGIKESLNSPMVWNIVFVVLLMIGNWSIEAIKWKMAVKPIQPISFLKAFRAVLSGVSFSVSLPNRVGEYLGRVLYMDEGNRLKTISITIVASISQLIITLLMGCIGWLFMQPVIEEKQLVSAIWFRVILYGMITATIVLTLFYFRLSLLIKWVDRLPGSKRFAYLVRALEDFNATLLLRLLSLSAFRFVVFIVQYYLLFRLFDVDISWWQTFWAVSVSFVVMAVIPSITLIEPVQRGTVMVMLSGLYSLNKLGIGFTATGIWFINLIVPAAIGSLLILGIKMKKNKNEEI